MIYYLVKYELSSFFIAEKIMKNKNLNALLVFVFNLESLSKLYIVHIQSVILLIRFYYLIHG